MRIIKNSIVLLFVVLAIQACQTHNVDQKSDEPSISDGKELILKNRVVLPLPESYQKVLVDDYSTIVSAREFSVLYRWIEKEEVEFIGSDKSPYDFYKSAFTNPSSAVEKQFLEGLDSKVHEAASSSGNLEFYYFKNGSVQQMYILSRSLSFAVEVTYKGQGEGYIGGVIESSRLK